MKPQIHCISVLLVMLIPLTTHSYKFMVDDLCYEINDDKKTVTLIEDNGQRRSSPLKGIIKVPAKVDYRNETYTVTRIGFQAFYQCSQIKSIFLPNTIIEIEDAAFVKCGIESITLPSCLKKITGFPFFGCDNLKYVYSNIKDPFGVTYNVIAMNPTFFKYVNIFKDFQHDCWLIVPHGSVDLYLANEDWTMNGLIHVICVDPKNTIEVNGLCYSIEPDGRSVTVVRKDWFGRAYPTLSGVVSIPESIRHNGKSYNVIGIGDFAFSACNKITEIILNGNILTFGRYSFAGCNQLAKITYDVKPTLIQRKAFRYCRELSFIKSSKQTEFKTDTCFYIAH